MGPHRQQYQLGRKNERSQRGVTVIGFLILATLIGIVGLGALKLVPIYLNNMRLNTILDDIERDYQSSGRGPTDIRLDLNSRFAVEGLRIPREAITINQGRNAYQLRVQLENRELFMADIYFLVLYDRQVDIPR